MFRFLFGKKGQVEAVKETQRQTAERALKELNAVLSALPAQPAITVGAEGAVLDVVWPEQMPDEAVALPPPSTQELAKTQGEDAATAEKDAADAAKAA